jgi:hypothetical protein
LADIVAAFDAAKASLSEEQGGGSPTQHHRGSASVSRGWSKMGAGKTALNQIRRTTISLSPSEKSLSAVTESLFRC